MAITDAAYAEYEQDVLRSAEDNHMWINAFACIRPTAELCEQIGREVLHKLGQQETTIVSSLNREGALMYDMDEKIPAARELVIRFNKS